MKINTICTMCGHEVYAELTNKNNIKTIRRSCSDITLFIEPCIYCNDVENQVRKVITKAFEQLQESNND